MYEGFAPGWLRAQATPTSLIVMRLYSKAHSEVQSHTVIKEIVDHHNGGDAIATTHCNSIIRRHEPARAGMHQPTKRRPGEDARRARGQFHQVDAGHRLERFNRPCTWQSTLVFEILKHTHRTYVCWRFRKDDAAASRTNTTLKFHY